MSSEWYYESARVLARRIRKRELSSVELVDAFLSRIERVNPAINAIVTLDPERARAEAKRADQILASGAPVGPLHGLPMTVKDAFEVAGMRTTAGARRWSDHVPATDALAVQRLRQAGAIIAGKTNTPAYCSDFQSYNDIFGTTNNPWDPTRTPGGSSGGSAAALAAGLTPLELASDIAGSIRIPAGFCGVFGHKPTHGTVPMRGHIPGPPGTLAIADLAVTGPMGRDPDDLAFMLSSIAGPTSEAAKGYTLRFPPPRATSLRSYRVAAWLDDPFCPIDAEVKTSLQGAVEALRRAGVAVVEAQPDFKLGEVYALYRELLDPILVAGSTKVIAQLESIVNGPKDAHIVITARNSLARHADWILANERRAQLRVTLARFFEDYDVLLCPVAPLPAIKHDHSKPQFARKFQINGQSRDYNDFMAWPSFATAAYLPSTAAPVGRTKSGLPVGIQVVGAYLEDLTTIDFAGRLSELTGGFVRPPGF